MNNVAKNIFYKSLCEYKFYFILFCSFLRVELLDHKTNLCLTF